MLTIILAALLAGPSNVVLLIAKVLLRQHVVQRAVPC